ncbi:MAG: HIT family protein [Bacteroidetes bacterium]|nr:HIT family protein [Bacteroidota bacterium]
MLLNIMVSKGHVLVITKRHYCDYFSLTEEEKMEAWNMISEIQIWVKEKHSPDGYNIGINISEAAGQTIAHAHIHLIPRYKEDINDPRGGIRHCIENKGYYSTE